MNRLLSCLVLAALAPLVACGSSSEAAPAAPTAPAAQAHTTAPPPGCAEVFTRARSCSPDYVAAIVDVRARLDAPPGMRADVQADRPAVIAKATAEWQADSTDAAIAATCEKLAAQPPAAEELDRARRCVAEQDCAAFVACVMPIFEAHLAGFAKQMHK